MRGYMTHFHQVNQILVPGGSECVDIRPCVHASDIVTSPKRDVSPTASASASLVIRASSTTGAKNVPRHEVPVNATKSKRYAPSLPFPFRLIAAAASVTPASSVAPFFSIFGAGAPFVVPAAPLSEPFGLFAFRT